MRGYQVGAGRPRDVTSHRLGGPWADGAIFSSTSDLARFFRALLSGALVPPELLAEMKKVIPRSHGAGLGLFNLQSTCRRDYFGHTGGTPGYATFAASSSDGKSVVVAAINGIGQDALRAFGGLIDRLLCPKR